MDTLNLRSAVLLGLAMGCAGALVYANTHNPGTAIGMACAAGFLLLTNPAGVSELLGRLIAPTVSATGRSFAAPAAALISSTLTVPATATAPAVPPATADATATATGADPYAGTPTVTITTDTDPMYVTT